MPCWYLGCYRVDNCTVKTPVVHWHIYYAPRAGKRRGMPACPSSFVTDGLGYHTRSDANRESRQYEHGVIVRQCNLPGCRMKHRWSDQDRGEAYVE